MWSLFLFKQYVIYEPLTAIPVLSLFQIAAETWRDREIYPKYNQVNGKQALTEWCALTSPQRTSLLSLFTQQPCAVADCMVMNILVPWFYSARVGADVPGEASSSASGGETGGFWGGRSPVALSCRCFRCTNKGLDGVVGTESQRRAGGLFTIITPSPWRHVIDSRPGHSVECLAISNTLYLESGYIIEVQQRPAEGGTSAGTFNL